MRWLMTAMAALMALLVATDAWAPPPRRHQYPGLIAQFRLDDVGGNCVYGTRKVDMTCAACPGVLTYATTTQPFIIDPGANTCLVGQYGVYGAAAISNLAQRASAESWAGSHASCTDCPTGWICGCTDGTGTADIDEDTTNVAHGSKGVTITLTGTDSSAFALGKCLTTGIGADMYASAWAKKNAGTSVTNISLREYDTAACATQLAQNNLANGDLAAEWTKYGKLVAAGDWHADTSSYRLYAIEFGDGGVSITLDATSIRAASLPTDAYCSTDADATAVCNHAIPSITSPISGNGTMQIEGVFRTPWDATGIASNMYLMTNGSVATANSYWMSVAAWTDEPLCGIYDASADLKYVAPNVANWAADTDYTVKFSKTPGGVLRLWWNSAWQTTMAGNGTGIVGASQTTAYLCSSDTAPANCWVKSLKFFRRLRK